MGLQGGPSNGTAVMAPRTEASDPSTENRMKALVGPSRGIWTTPDRTYSISPRRHPGDGPRGAGSLRAVPPGTGSNGR